jgi:hypothetical protein
MKPLKGFGLSAAIAMALLAILGVSFASATELYSGSTTLSKGTKISASMSGSSTLESTDGTLVGTCTGGNIEGFTSNTGGPTEAVSTELTGLSWSGCSFTTDTLSIGDLNINYTSGSNGTISGAEIKWTMPTAVTCRYGTGSGTTLGTVTGTTETSKHATIDIDAVINEQEPKSAFCPDTTRWKATYAVTTPTGFNVGKGGEPVAELYSTGVTLAAKTKIKVSLESGTTALRTTTDGSSILDTCTESTGEGEIASYASGPSLVKLSSTSWGGCAFTTHTLTTGELLIDSSGTVTGQNSVVTENIGVSCRYGPGGGSHLGTLSTGKVAINAVINEQEPKQFLCADTTKWVANYVFTSPHDLTAK